MDLILQNVKQEIVELPRFKSNKFLISASPVIVQSGGVVAHIIGKTGPQ